MALKLESSQVPENYISPAWAKVSKPLKSKKDVIKIVKKFWLVGFTEAEGSFFLSKDGPKRFRHSFSISQKHDLIVLEAIALILNLKIYKGKNSSIVSTTSLKARQVVLDYFKNTMKGMKYLEYQIWARSFVKRERGFTYLLKVRNLVRKLRSIRFSKNFGPYFKK